MSYKLNREYNRKNDGRNPTRYSNSRKTARNSLTSSAR